ncbi:hypothetical protein [Yoonia sp. R2-816]|uniref:hypothetical protein n=1 Tax=Yoonia sp. R2-816 TaxID=3342638 RepID=UPI0037277619
MEAEMREARIVRMLNHPIVDGRYGPAAEITGTDGKLYHVQIIPCRSQTSIQITDPSDEIGGIQLPSEQGGSGLLDRVIEVKRTDYGWDTPAYRQICAELKLDPDYGRPVYRDADIDLVTDLEAHIIWGAVGDDGKVVDLVLDLLDLLRTDRPPEYYAYTRCFATIENWHFKRPKDVFATALNRIDREKIECSRCVPTSVDFLPSWEGGGFSSSIYLWGSAGNGSGGWDADAYGRLRGVAVLPANSDWPMETVIHHLTQQGVVFLSLAEARDYMNNEGAYWAFCCGGVWQCPPTLKPRKPSGTEKLLWKVKRPKTPLFDQHELCPNQHTLPKGGLV